MTEWLTAKKLKRRTHRLRVEDLLLIPDPQSLPVLERALDEVARNRRVMAALPKGIKTAMGLARPFQVLMLLKHAYEDHCLIHEEPPAWSAHLPAVLIGDMENFCAVRGETDDVFHVMPKTFNRPNIGIGYVVLNDGLCEETIRTFGLQRLQGIRQLAFLHDPVLSAQQSRSLGMTFNHTRYAHSLDVMAIATLMAENNKLSGERQNILRVAALTHDALTPAGGDTVKQINFEAFDEDVHYPELLKRTDWSALKTRFGLNESGLISAVNGKGPLRTLLDLADKLSYVSTDAGFYLAKYDGNTMFSEAYEQVRSIVTNNPDVCALWDAVDVQGYNVVVTDALRLFLFLKLRLLLFKHLYLHPGARFLEHLFAHVVVKQLYESGKVTRDDLLTWTDEELNAVIDDFTGIPYSTSVVSSFGDPRVESFQTIEDAKRREAELNRQGVTLTLVEELKRMIKPETQFLVPADGTVKPFHEAHVNLTVELLKIAALEDPIRLYYMPDVELPGPFMQACLDYKKRLPLAR